MGLVIESLFPEFCNQGGDNGNMMYLRACLPDAEVIETHFTDEPAFASRSVDLIYAGYMTESEQKKVAEKLLPYRARLLELVDVGVCVLFTGNAAELLGREIVDEQGNVTPCLDVFDFSTRLSYKRRYTEVYLGEFAPGNAGDGNDGAGVSAEPMDIVGYKIQFTQAYGNNQGCAFCKNKVGYGLNKDQDTGFEGFRKNNLIATWLCGPLLPLNPDFTLWLLDNVTGGGSSQLAFEQEARAAYEKRRREFKTPGIHLEQ